MFKSFVFLVLWASCSAHCNVTSSTCGQKEIYNSDLDLAIDLIVRSKYTLPKIPADWFPKASDCADVLQMGVMKTGIYEIWPMSRVTEGNEPLSVYCDMDTNGGGWTVIQRRGDFQRPMDYFYKDWKSYKNGFGDKQKDFWLGNDNIFALTNQKLYSVRFDLKDVEQNKRYALYDKFWIDDEDYNYTLHILDYSGDAGDSMTYHNNQPFSTNDRKNNKGSEEFCAEKYKGAWWYNGCHHVNLNGLYYKWKTYKYDGISWLAWRGYHDSLEWTEIKIRPKNFRVSSS